MPQSFWNAEVAGSLLGAIIAGIAGYSAAAWTYRKEKRDREHVARTKFIGAQELLVVEIKHNLSAMVALKETALAQRSKSGAKFKLIETSTDRLSISEYEYFFNQGHAGDLQPETRALLNEVYLKIKNLKSWAQAQTRNYLLRHDEASPEELAAVDKLHDDIYQEIDRAIELSEKVIPRMI
jgi:hypothetical protein